MMSINKLRCEFIDRNGIKIYIYNGEYHRLDGPAIEYSNGSKYWYQNGKYHREDGPAVELCNGDKLWFLYGKQYSEKMFKDEIAKLNIK